MQSLQSLHTFSLPASCRSLITVTDPAQLTRIDFNAAFYILGAGSNTVFLEDFDGTVLRMANRGIEVSEDEDAFYLRVAAGEDWHALVCRTLEQGMPGLENLALIPGTVGAAPVQNIGAYGVELAQFVDYVEGYDIGQGETRRLSAAQCRFGYRDSVFKHALHGRFVITHVGLKLPKAWRPVLSYGPLQSLKNPSAKEIFDRVVEIRREKLPDPGLLPNAGSFFKNPVIGKDELNALLAEYPELPHYPYDANHVKVAAGWLIDRAGLKGFRIEGIEVCPSQALVLTNHGNSQGRDLLRMIGHIQDSICERFGIRLEHEVRLLDQQGEIQLEARA